MELNSLPKEPKLITLGINDRRLLEQIFEKVYPALMGYTFSLF